MKNQIKLETQLVELGNHKCPAKNWDEVLQTYGCIYDGRVCNKVEKERCTIYLDNYAWRVK